MPPLPAGLAAMPVVAGCGSCKRAMSPRDRRQGMPRLRLDALDRKIIAELQINSRLSVQDLAHRIGLSASPCARRIRMLEEAGVITGYAAIIDQTKVGLPISV